MTTIVPSYIAKVSRAKKHLVDLNEAVRIYEDSHPYTVRERIEGKKKRRTHRLALKSSPTNTDIPIIAADAIYNLRSALDHLMSALVASKDRGSAEFPIFFKGVWEAIVPGENQQRVKDRARWASHVKTLPDEAIAVIKALQPPDTGPENPTTHLLAMVNRFSNRDRHEKLPVVAAGITDLHVQITGADGARKIVRVDGILEDNALLKGVPEDAVDVQIAGTPLVAIQRGAKGRYVQIPERLVDAFNLIESRVIPSLSPFVRPN